MYSARDFAAQLKKQTENQEPLESISLWANDVFFREQRFLRGELRGAIQTVAMMEMGPEFELSYAELNEIAERLGESSS